MRTTSTLDVALIFLMCTIWAGNYFVVKDALTYVDPVTFSLMRGTLGGVFVMLIGGYAVHQFKRRDFVWLTLMGLFNVTLFLLLLAVSLLTASPGVDATLVYTQPIMVVALAPLLGEELTPRRILGIAAAFAGVVLVFLPDIMTSTFVIGDVYALGCALSWAIAVIIFKKWNTSADPRTITAFQGMIGGVLVLPALALERPFLDPTLPFWIFLAYNVLLASSVVYVMYLRMLTRMPASQFSTYFFLVPVLATIMGSILQLGVPPWNAVAGTLLVALGIFVVNR